MSDLLSGIRDEVADRLGAALRGLTIERAVLGLFFVGVKLNNGAGGLCATPLKGIPQGLCRPNSAQAMTAPGKLQGRPVGQVLLDLGRRAPLRRALAIATLNALVETVWRWDGAPEGVRSGDGDALAALGIEPHHHVALVGGFPSYLREFMGSGQSFTVLESGSEALKPEELPFYVPVTQAAEVIPQAHAVVISGTTLVHSNLEPSLEDLLGLARPGTSIALIGPSVPLWPAPFIKRGVGVLGGVRITDADRLLDCLAEGGSDCHLVGQSAEWVTLRAPIMRKRPRTVRLVDSAFCPRFFY